MYLSKFGESGLRQLGFSSFTEAFNVLGFALGGKPASIKNYRDEFDPLFPNPRKGWHQRATRPYCLEMFRKYKELNLSTFAELIQSFASGQGEIGLREPDIDADPDEHSPFAKRLVTGLAAERYFASVCSGVPQFKNYAVEDRTMEGCGYDFRLHHALHAEDCLAVEVKGLWAVTGSLALTAKEYATAETLGARFYLFVVRNFAQKPFHEVIQDPTRSQLQFRKTERVVIQTSWLTNL